MYSAYDFWLITSLRSDERIWSKEDHNVCHYGTVFWSVLGWFTLPFTRTSLLYYQETAVNNCSKFCHFWWVSTIMGRSIIRDERCLCGVELLTGFMQCSKNKKLQKRTRYVSRPSFEPSRIYARYSLSFYTSFKYSTLNIDNLRCFRLEPIVSLPWRHFSYLQANLVFRPLSTGFTFFFISPHCRINLDWS